jgi:hypothetical protein
MSSSSKPGEASNYFHGVAVGYRIGVRLGCALGLCVAMAVAPVVLYLTR